MLKIYSPFYFFYNERGDIMVEERFILRVLGSITTLIGSFALGFGSFARGHVEEWIIDYTSIIGVVLLLGGSALLIKSVWKR